MALNHKMCIYRFISPSGKSYVGQAYDYLDRQKCRMYSYNHWLKIKDDESYPESERKGSNPRLFLAFLKYGVDNFRAEILEENIETRELLNEREIYYIDFYDCIKNGYNVIAGGKLGVNPLTGRSFHYGDSPYFANRTDDLENYRKEWYNKNQQAALDYCSEYRETHQDRIKTHRENNKEKENFRRLKQYKYLSDADKEVFGVGVLAICFRHFFGGGRTRSKGFVAPKGCVNEQLCWLFGG